MIDQAKKARSRVCPKCNSENRIGVVFCESCGTPMTTSARKAAATRAVPEDVVEKFEQLNDNLRASKTINVRKSMEKPHEILREGASKQSLPPEINAGTALFKTGYYLALFVKGMDYPLEIDPPEETMLVFGRNDPDDYYEPEIDLIPYDGYSNGISRRHAAIKLKRRRIELTDLKSSNGTYLNGERIEPGVPMQIRDGDQIRMGGLKMVVHFRV